MLGLKLTTGIVGMVSSFLALGSPKVLENDWLQGGAVVSFIGFLLWVIRMLWAQNKKEREAQEKLQTEVRQLMHETIKKSSETNDALVAELRTRRQERNNGPG